MLKGEKKNSDSETVSTKVTKRNSDEEKVKVWLRETHSCLTEELHQNNNKIKRKRNSEY